MKTRMPIGTISFNSAPFLALKLRELTKAKIIEWWFFICHKPEDDEAGLKPHIHLWIQPAKSIQTEELRDEFLEPDPNNDKPLGCLPFKSSKFADAYLYFLHNEPYLASKGQARRFHYRHSDFITSDADMLLSESRQIDMMSISPYADMLDAIENGIGWDEYFSRGRVPIPLIKQFRDAWFTLVGHEGNTFRNGREGHPSGFVVNEDGEIIDN